MRDSAGIPAFRQRSATQRRDISESRLHHRIHEPPNLGWKLALVVKGISPDSLLDTYHTERHPVAARALRLTMAMTALSRGDERTTALREMLPEVMQMNEPRKWYAALISALGVRYELGEGHELLGRRMPDLDLVTADGPLRVFSLLQDARAVLLNLGSPGRFDISAWADRVRSIDASYDGGWDLPGVGEVVAPGAVLIRPDGHVAWVDEAPEREVTDTLTAWFGEGATGQDATCTPLVAEAAFGSP